MIRLLVEDYCHKGCRAFEAEVEEPPTYYDSANEMLDIDMNTLVRCAKRNLCKQLMRYLKRAEEVEV